ncbi:type II toxin-antitoxin system RelE/ParE family toxin [Pseudanabaenaceae cyanobacterium LEGE 13415]|nr:type II toxin-antitoxin system RelE/ParE family toxin [Pseudanabaenaceae cyanobacterium LEGE 13415]
MTYAIVTPKVVQKQLDALPDEIYQRIFKKLEKLTEDPRPDGVTKLKGLEDEYRIRIGDYRVRYKINDSELLILLVQCKHRKDSYRK